MTKNNSSSLTVSVGPESGVAWLRDSSSESLMRLQSDAGWHRSHLKACVGVENPYPRSLTHMAGTSGLVVCRKPQFLSISFSKGSGLPHNLAGGFLWASISGDREGRRERERRERGRERLEAKQKEALSSL